LGPGAKSLLARGHIYGPGRTGPPRYEVTWDLTTGKPTSERTLADLPRMDPYSTDGRRAVFADTTTRPAAPGESNQYYPTIYTTDHRARDGLTGRLLAPYRVPDEYHFNHALSADNQTVALVTKIHGAVPAHPPARMDLRL